jgi:hypothetical protein
MALIIRSCSIKGIVSESEDSEEDPCDDEYSEHMECDREEEDARF